MSSSMPPRRRVARKRASSPVGAGLHAGCGDPAGVAGRLGGRGGKTTVELAPGSVELRLRGREPQFVVTSPPTDTSFDRSEESDDALNAWVAPRGTSEGDDMSMSRINVRMPEHLKAPT